MLGKLLKHEFKNSGRRLLTVYACAAATILFIYFGMLTKTTWIGVVGSIVLYIAAVAVILVTLVAIIRNFNDTLYGNQGYLSFTLPVKCSTLLISKVLASFVWVILSFVFGGLSIFVIIMNAKTMADGSAGGIVEMIRESGILELLPSADLVIKAVLLIIAAMFTSIITFVGFVYFSVTVANTRPLQKHPLLYGVLIFFVTYGVTSAIGAKLTSSFPLSLNISEGQIMFAIRSMADAEDVLVSFGVAGELFMAIVALALLFVTGYIMEHKVNVK